MTCHQSLEERSRAIKKLASYHGTQELLSRETMERQKHQETQSELVDSLQRTAGQRRVVAS